MFASFNEFRVLDSLFVLWFLVSPELATHSFVTRTLSGPRCIWEAEAAYPKPWLFPPLLTGPMLEKPLRMKPEQGLAWWGQGPGDTPGFAFGDRFPLGPEASVSREG